MQGKPHHKMPVSSWMVPGGNRDQKRKLIQTQQYPMKSAIKKNLGGPLSEVFFSSLTPLQQDHVGYTPKLQGPGQDLWVSPSDNLIGKVILKPPFTKNIKKSLTHKGILEIGAEIEEKIIRAHEIEIEEALKQKEEEMKKVAEKLIKQAIDDEKRVQRIITDQILEAAQNNLSSTYQTILTSTIDELMLSAMKRMEEAVLRTRHQMKEDLCRTVESHQQYLDKQYELQVSWMKNQLEEKYENRLKKQGQKCTEEIERITTECRLNICKSLTNIQAEHVTDLVVQACEKSLVHHEEKKNLEGSFKNWFVSLFDNEIMNRDFTIIELENIIRKLETQRQQREEQLKDVFRHFQKFINYALKEKPGQAEFLISLEKELKSITYQVKTEGEVEFIAKMILDYILKCIANKEEHITIPTEEVEINMDNFRDHISDERNKNRILTLVGEEKNTQKLEMNNLLSKNKASEDVFKNKRLKSLVGMFKSNPTMIKVISSLNELTVPK